MAAIGTKPLEQVVAQLESGGAGLSEQEADRRRRLYGPNEIPRQGTPSWPAQLLASGGNPLVLLLGALAALSLISGQAESALIILTIVIFSVILRFSQEFRSSRAVAALRDLVLNTATVSRPVQAGDRAGQLSASLDLGPSIQEGQRQDVPMRDLVPGDVILLAAGDMVPADVRLLQSKDLYVSQAALTGESLPVEKHCAIDANTSASSNPLDLESLCFLGTAVVSGAARAVVVQTGGRTILGSMAEGMLVPKSRTGFDKGVNDVSGLLLRFMLVMAPSVFLINGLLKGNWGEAFFFALSVAVGLTPEMLPMIVTANLARGAIAMSKQQVIVKNINSIQCLGAMETLCTDKTGTLTQDHIALKFPLDMFGREREEVLEFAYLNSTYQSGLKNLLDVAILEHRDLEVKLNVRQRYRKIDEIPFDFVRRRMSVVVDEEGHHHELICKGAVEEIAQICDKVRIDGQAVALDAQLRNQLHQLNHNLNDDGLRVIAVAYKEVPPEQTTYGIADERALTLIGLMAFLDPPKDSARQALAALASGGVQVKVLTGDNAVITQKTCKDVGLAVAGILLGDRVESLDDGALLEAAASTTIFAKLTPLQKARIVRVLRSKGSIVGFMGDGINDAAALREADVGISVDTGAAIAKDAADIILLEKNLMVLQAGILEGRRTFGNIVKYIKMGTSSNFGNMFSMVGASALLPFLPMLPVQILVNNLLYDLSQTGIPFDRVDREYLAKPRQWLVGDIQRFMLKVGPISSLFDYLTFGLMWFVFQANTPAQHALFQTGWFVESLMTQVLIVHIIRTPKIPFLQSRASWPLLVISATVMALAIALPFTPAGPGLGLVPLPAAYFGWLGLILAGYCLLTQRVKTWFIQRYGYN
jgi:Mg2+-importing ATPase